MIISGTAETRYEMICPKCDKKYSWIGKEIPPCPNCPKEKKAKARDISTALALADEIQSLAEELPSEGEDFGMSVMEKSAEITMNIETHQRVTEGQFSALENMLSGLQRWFHD